MYPSQRSNRSPSVFVAPKAATAIPVAHELVRDALIQAALDPAVRAIEFVPTVDVSGTNVQIDAIVVSHADGRYLLDVMGARTICDIDEVGLVLMAIDKLALPTLTVTPADLRRQPYASNCCLVWNSRNVRVRASDRVRILQALTEDGPMPLDRVAAEARWTTDPIGTVLSMACQDLVEMDLVSGPLGPETRVRRRSNKGGTHG